MYCLKATRRAPHMEHELFTLPEHMNSLKACSVQCFALIVCPCNCFLLPIVLTVVLLLTTSNYTYGIFSFFFCFFFLSIIFRPLLDFVLPIFVLPIFLRFTASDPKSTSCLSMVGGSLRVLRLLPPQKLVAMI